MMAREFTETQLIRYIQRYLRQLAFFEENRYAGQENHQVNLEFLYHLATQIKAVTLFKLASNTMIV